MSPTKNTEIQDFYQDTGVFITGGTGTLGKLTIEKILRSCPGVRRIYVLIRSKKGLSVEERKKDLLDNVVFERMKSEQPNSVEKIVFVPGDCSAPRLGLSNSDYHDLTQHSNIVLHLAANVRFDDKLKTLVDINMKGTQGVIELCHGCSFLKAAVFVSTTFSNCVSDVVKEEFYDPPITIEDLNALFDRLTTTELDILGSKIMGAWPNAYVFSKAMSENVILKQSKGLPFSIVRPSIVVGTLKDPVPGWIDNMYGAIAIVTGVASGILRVSISNLDTVLDIIPADTVTNCIITAALSSSKGINEGVSIYNVATSDTNPLKIREFMNSIFTILDTKPLKMCIWYPLLYNVTSYSTYMFLAFFLHFLPGCLLDFALRMSGRPPKILKIYRKIQQHNILLRDFSLRNFTFTTDNTRSLYNNLESKDRELFSLDTYCYNWSKYLPQCFDELRKYVLNGMINGVDEGRSLTRKLYILHTTVKYLLYGLALWTAWRLLSLWMPELPQHY